MQPDRRGSKRRANASQRRNNGRNHNNSVRSSFRSSGHSRKCVAILARFGTRNRRLVRSNSKNQNVRHRRSRSRNARQTLSLGAAVRAKARSHD